MKSSSQPIYSIELFIVDVKVPFIIDFTITIADQSEHAIEIRKINGSDVSWSSGIAKTIDLSCKILHSIEYNGVSYFPEKNICYVFPFFPITDKYPTDGSMLVSISNANSVEPIKHIYLLPLDDFTPFMDIDGTFEYPFRVASSSGQQQIVVLYQINNEYKWLIDANKTTYSICDIKIFREIETVGCPQ
jgi:hypothetical protein